MSARIKKGDTVLILSGKNQDRKGKVIQVFPSLDKVVVENVAVVKKHQKPTREFQGGIIEKPMPIPTGKVMLVCPRCNEPAKVAYKTIKGGKKVRVCKRCEEIVDKV